MQSVRSLALLALLSVLFSCEKEEITDVNGTVFFAADDLFEIENATIPLGITIGITNPAHQGGTIQVSITGGVYGEDYETSEGASDFTLEVEPNVLSSSFSIKPVDDDIIEDDKELMVAITGVSGSLQLGDKTGFKFTILDNDVEAEPEPIAIDFDATSTTVSEGSDVIIIPVVTSEMLSEETTVQVSVGSASTATAGDDFTLNGESGSTVTLTLPAGGNGTTLELAIVDDADQEEEEVLVLDLINAPEGFLIGTNSQLTYNIQDNDQGPPPFFYLENFEGNDGSPDYLNTVLGYQNVLADQTIDASNIMSLINSAGNFADENDINGASDNGLNMFYNSGQDAANFGQLDNLVITTLLDGQGSMQVNFDVSYAFKNQNNGELVFYWSQTYDGSGTWNESDWTVMGTETAATMDAEGYGNNIYKRETFMIEPTAGFYIAVRVRQVIDDTFYRMRWRVDNIRVAIDEGVLEVSLTGIF